MDPITVTFLSIGGLAILLLALSLLGGHLHLGHLHVGHPHPIAGHPDVGGQFTLPAVAGFIGAFGFAGAVGATLARGHGAGTVLVAALFGLVAAVPAGWLAGRLVRAAMNLPTDATPTSLDLIGGTGVVISAIPADGYGQVRVTVGGHLFSLNARADEPLERGTPIFVIEVPSPTSVLVVPLPQLKEP